jgi:molecular chaperone DnaK (HSP70)
MGWGVDTGSRQNGSGSGTGGRLETARRLDMADVDAEVIVGIDLGTTNSLVAVCDARGPRVIEDGAGRALLPSVVRYEAGGRVVVGHEARERAVEFPLSTVSSVKRLMGRSVRDAAADLPYLSYRVVEGPHETARVELGLGEHVERVVSPQEVSAVILRELRERASAALGVEVRKAVVTVPAYFDNAQREATKDAGRLAGLEVVRIVPEPTAAALAYGFGGVQDAARKGTGPRTIAVYDLGGGTFDISILRLTPAEAGSATDFFQVLATDGDTHLGGDDVDHALVAVFTREIVAQMMGSDVLSDAGTPGLAPGTGGTPVPPGSMPLGSVAFPPSTRRALVTLAEQVKCKLSERESASVRIEVDEATVYERTVTRAELEAIMAPWVERTIERCERAMRAASRPMGTDRLEAVILVGGATRTPLVRKRVGEFFGLEPYTALDPDKVVALGAAVQGALLSGAATGALLLDVIPLSLGIETVGGAVAKLIMRNSTVPARATDMFSTSVDGQTSIKLHVLQGEREMAADCRSLGEFHLRGLPPMPAGIPQVEVEFLVDASGVLNVSARERRSGKRAALQVIPNHGLTREEVDRIEAASLAHAREDMTRHRVVDLIANGKLDLKWIGERLERLAEKLEPAYRAELEGRIAELRRLIGEAERDWTSVDPNALHTAKDGLDRASVRLQEISIAESLRD